MSTLKQQFEKDLQTVKTLNLDIMPAKIYYPTVILGYLLVFALFLGIQATIAYIGTQKQVWPYISDHVRWSLESEKDSAEWHENFDKPELDDVEFDFHAEHIIPSEKEKQEIEKLKKIAQKKYDAEMIAFEKRQEKIQKKYERDREYYHDGQVGKMVLGIIASSLAFMLFWMGKVKNYIIFRIQIRNQLQSGFYLDRLMKIGFVLFFLAFAAFASFTILLMEQDLAFFAGILAFILATFAANFLIHMEANRIGVSLISTAVSQFFEDRGKPVTTNQ